MLSPRVSHIAKRRLPQVHKSQPSMISYKCRYLFCPLNGSETPRFQRKSATNLLPDLSSSSCVAKINVTAFRTRRRPGAREVREVREVREAGWQKHPGASGKLTYNLPISTHHFRYSQKWGRSFSQPLVNQDDSGKSPLLADKSSKWAIFNSKLSVYRRVTTGFMFFSFFFQYFLGPLIRSRAFFGHLSGRLRCPHVGWR